MEFTALMKAVENDNINVAQVLLSHGASVNAQNEVNETYATICLFTKYSCLISLLCCIHYIVGNDSLNPCGAKPKH